jgi:hypothetical protein
LRRRLDHKGAAEETPATASALDSGDPKPAFDAAHAPFSIASATRPPGQASCVDPHPRARGGAGLVRTAQARKVDACGLIRAIQQR